MWIYYRDVTLYALAICVLFGLATLPMRERLLDALVTTLVVFGVFGTGLGVLAFQYFQKQQYYMYHNLGFTKRFLIIRTWAVNIGLACILLLICIPFL